MSRRQHSKGLKRPRSWHRSRSSTTRYWKAIRRMNLMFERAESR